MAISPTFSTSNQYIKYRIVVEESNVNVAANTSVATVYVQAWRTNTGYTTDGAGTCYCGIDGGAYSNSWRYNDGHAIKYNSYTELFRTSVTIAHETNGAKNIWVSASITHNNFSASDQGFWVTLTTIPRYATAYQSFSSKDEGAISMNWSSDSTIDHFWFSTNDGASWTDAGGTWGSYGSYTAYGLQPNTTYYVKTRLRRADSQLTTDTASIAITTYDFPKPTSANNFIIGDGAYVDLYNPLNKQCTLELIGADGSVIGTYSGTYAGTIHWEFNTTEAIDKQYKSIPNSVSGTYSTKVTCWDVIRYGPTGTYSVNPSLVTPSIGDITYADTEETTLDITDNDQQIIQNASIVRYRATGLATQRYATISRVEVSVNNSTYQLGLESSGTAAAGGNAAINSSQNVTAVCKIIDSRGLSATKSVEITMLEYSLPSAIITLQRHNNYYSDTDTMVDANISSLDSKNTVTIQARYKKKSDQSYGSYITLQENVTTLLTLDNSYEWDVQYLISDLLGSTTYNLTLQKGMPIIYFDTHLNSVGIESFPTNTADLSVDGISFKEFYNKIIPQYCVATITTAPTISSNYYVPLDATPINEGYFTLQNGGIRIHSGINRIRVSGSVFIDNWPAGAAYLWVRIFRIRGTQEVPISGSINGSPSAYMSSSVPTRIIDVQEGDIIKIMADSGAGGTIRPWSENTWLCVEKIS